MVRVHALSGVDARTCDAADALATLADMTGHDVATLRMTRGGYVEHWTYRDAGSIVGRVESIQALAE